MIENDIASLIQQILKVNPNNNNKNNQAVLKTAITTSLAVKTCKPCLNKVTAENTIGGRTSRLCCKKVMLILAKIIAGCPKEECNYTIVSLGCV